MRDPIRILHAVVNMNRGGAETLIMNLYRNMDHSRIQFDFLTSKEGVFDPEIIALGGKIHRIPYISESGHSGYIKALNSFFSAHKEYKIVHSHMDKMSGFVLRAAKKSGIPVRIAHSHNTRSEGSLLARTYKWYAGKWIRSSSTHLLACSTMAARWLFAGQAGNIQVVKNGIECENFDYSPEIRKQVREELNIEPELFVVGHVGRFSRQKNHSFLIKIFEEIIKIRPKSAIVLAGDGPLRKMIENQAAELCAAGKVKFLGLRSDIHRLLQAFDVFVFPSFHEGLPVTLIEAQGAGLPCVISDAITPEVDLGAGMVVFESIDHSPVIWAAQVLNHDKRNKNARTAVKRNGYDIQDVACWLQEYYIRSIKEQKHVQNILSS